MSWHYQVMRHKADEEEWFEVHGYFPLEDGNLWTNRGVIVGGESIEDIKCQLKAMLNDIEFYGVKDCVDD